MILELFLKIICLTKNGSQSSCESFLSSLSGKSLMPNAYSIKFPVMV